MKRSLALIASLAVLAASASTFAQTRRGRAARPAASASPAAALVAQLPTSDAVLAVDVKRLFSEGLPRAYANNAAELARVNAEIDKFKEQTGLDARQFERVAFGARYGSAPSGATTVEVVALARGAFNAGALVAAGRLASQGKYEEQRYAGKTIYVFSLDQQVKLLGLFKAHLTRLAVAQLDANTLAVGKIERVRAAVDAAGGRGRLAPEVAALATRDDGAIIGLGGNVPASATRGLDFLSPEFSRSIAAIRQFYGSVGTTAEGFRMMTTLRTTDAASAKTLGDNIEALKQFAPFAIGQVARGDAEKARLLRGVVTATRVAPQGEELQISLELAQSEFAALLQAF
ncbi:MAG: hypothetical protein LC746_13960 [Acidobacteria bacterium]|nr:hypothetical protein [Acidobacteriota bacterium]